MSNFDGCQLPSVPKFAVGLAEPADKSLVGQIKRMLAVPWNYHAKKWLKRVYYTSLRWRGVSSAQTAAKDFASAVPLQKGDLVRVRSSEEITATLDPFKELKGCA